jgi:ABC-type phosphate transport system substrate-binding protein
VRTGYKYNLISGSLFLAMAIYLFVERPALNMMPEAGDLGNPLAWVLLFWAVFRYYTAYLQWVKKKREDQGPNLGVLIFWVSTLGMTACTPFNFQQEGNDVPTAGHLKTAFDAGDSFVVTQWLDQFQVDYPNAHIEAEFITESGILKAVEQSAIESFYLHRYLDSTEIDALESRGVKVRSVEVAKTSVAVIVGKGSSLGQLSQKEFRERLTQSGVWVCERTGSELRSAIAYARNGLQDSSIWRVQEAGSLEQLFRVLNADPMAIGLVSLNVISDKKDARSLQYRSQCKALTLENIQTGEFVGPYQSEIVRNRYPMIQPIVAYDLQGYSGLAAGLMAFISSQPGQIIAKKSGLMPHTQPARTIQLQ